MEATKASSQLPWFGSVAPDGQYRSPVRNKSARFNAMLAALTPSRLAVAFQAMGVMKLGLTIAIRYSHRDMDESGEHHPQQTDTRTENETPDILTHSILGISVDLGRALNERHHLRKGTKQIKKQLYKRRYKSVPDCLPKK
ncbi:uncharacterized protein LOC100399243 isoform X2 [Callithrix jacchus]